MISDAAKLCVLLNILLDPGCTIISHPPGVEGAEKCSLFAINLLSESHPGLNREIVFAWDEPGTSCDVVDTLRINGEVKTSSGCFYPPESCVMEPGKGSKGD